jgi:hydrogenase expression/formation protein HypC
MCIGFPMQVVTANASDALCERGGERCTLDTTLLPDLAPGTWVLAHRGSAIRILDPVEAGQMTAALGALAALLEGDTDVDAAFPDLAGRTPTLPEHLRGDSK